MKIGSDNIRSLIVFTIILKSHEFKLLQSIIFSNQRKVIKCWQFVVVRVCNKSPNDETRHFLFINRRRQAVQMLYSCFCHLSRRGLRSAHYLSPSGRLFFGRLMLTDLAKPVRRTNTDPCQQDNEWTFVPAQCVSKSSIRP